jgi:hypothetical protein
MSRLAVGQLEGLASESYRITVASGSRILQAGAILQVVSATKTNTATTTSSTYSDIDGLSVSITPTTTSSRIYISAALNFGSSNSNTTTVAQLVRGSTAICIGDAASNRRRASVNAYTEFAGSFKIDFVDSPSTTSATTYKIQWASLGGAACFMNRVNFNDDDADVRPRTASTITVMEVAG